MVFIVFKLVFVYKIVMTSTGVLDLVAPHLAPYIVEGLFCLMEPLTKPVNGRGTVGQLHYTFKLLKQ